MHWEARRSGWKPQAEDARTPSDVDYGRVIHSASFRRLQGKTQILNLGDSDFYRTRLTHSLEVAQIGAGIVRQFAKHLTAHPAHDHLPDASLIQALGFTHDLGHPPFGHGGEVALNYCMREDGGYEGNGQTLRILSRLEKMSASEGADLTRRTMLGILKYPVPYSQAFNPALTPRLDPRPTAIQILDRKSSTPPKCYLDAEADVVDWILEPLAPSERELFQTFDRHEAKHHKARHKSFDCSIMDVADDIAYGVHDLEDAVALGLIDEAQFRGSVTEADCSTFLDSLKDKYPDESANNVYEKFTADLFRDSNSRKRCINRLVHHFITAVDIVTVDAFAEPLLRYRAAIPDGHARLLVALKGAVRDHVILSPSVQQLEFKGQKMVVSVFEVLKSEPRAFLPTDTYRLFAAVGGDVRVICDYIAGMTDNFLLKTYDRLFSPRMGSIFDRI